MAADTATVPWQVRLTAEEKRAFTDAAALRRVNVSTWARTHLRAAAAADLKAFGQKCSLPEMKVIARPAISAGDVVQVSDVLTVRAEIPAPSSPPPADTRIGCVLKEDPSKPAIVPRGGRVDAEGRIYDARGRFIGTAVIAPPVSRETIPTVIHNVKVDVAEEATFAGGRVVRNENLTRLMRGEPTGIDDTHCMAVPRPGGDDFTLDEPAAPVSQDPPEE